MDKKGNYLALILLESLEDENFNACKQLILTYKANPNTIVVDRGIAPIHYSCGMENVGFAEEITKLMLDMGGNPNVRSDDKLTPLHVAAIWGRKNIVKMLLDKGGDVDAVDDENKTPILYAVYECHFDVVKIIQNYIFEKKIEEKKKSMLVNASKNRDMTNGIENNNLLMVKKLEEKKLTPNRINYNFDVTSPYYINITHRRKNTSQSINKSSNADLKSFHEHKPDNLFELTEENLMEYAKKLSPEHSKVSFINAWREKVQKSKSRKSIINQFNDIESFLDGIIHDKTIDFTNTALFVDGEDIDEENQKAKEKSFNSTQFGKLLKELKNQEKTDESFITAQNDLNDLSPQKLNQSNFIKRNDEFVMQTAEEYVHTDEENGLVFYEKRLITNKPKSRPYIVRNDLNKSQTSESTDFSIPLDYDTDALRKELTYFGDVPGPITKSTKKLYMKRLIKYKRDPQKLALQRNFEEKNYRPNFSIELEKTIRNKEWFARIVEYMRLEAEVSQHFKNTKDLKREWREGHLKTSFIYLLIDPRISDNLPGQSVYMEKHDIWKKFLNSIFYVGKGKRIRPYQHLYDAMKIFSRFHEKENQKALKEKNNLENLKKNEAQKSHNFLPLYNLSITELKNITDNKKIERILEIWKSEKGVICLHVFHNILPAEAYTREAAIIDAIGLEHLTNMKRGDYYGLSKTWSMRQRKCLGIALLYKAFQIFLVEGESQLLPSDLI